MGASFGPGAIAFGDGAASVSAHSGNAPSRGDVVLQLRVDADEIEGCGGGNEAANMRRAADLIEEMLAEMVEMTKAMDRVPVLLTKAKREMERAADEERSAVVGWLRACAEGFREVPVQYPAGAERREATAYSLDAVLRYQSAANQIEAGAHHPEPSPADFIISPHERQLVEEGQHDHAE